MKETKERFITELGKDNGMREYNFWRKHEITKARRARAKQALRQPSLPTEKLVSRRPVKSKRKLLRKSLRKEVNKILPEGKCGVKGCIRVPTTTMMRYRWEDLQCSEENHRYFGCNGTFTWCQCNIEEDKTKMLKYANDENDIVVDKTRIAVMTDDGWVEGLVEYAQVVKGARGRQHTAYHVNVEFPSGPMHVTIGLDGTPPLCEMEWWIVGQEGDSSDEEPSSPRRTNSSSESPVRDDSPLRRSPSSVEDEDFPPFDSRTGSPILITSTCSSDTSSSNSQSHCQTPYAIFSLHPEAVQNHDQEPHVPPTIDADDESSSSISDVEWETVHQPLEHVVDSMIEAGQDIISAVNEFSNLITRTMRESSPTPIDNDGLGIPQSTKKRLLPMTSRTIVTRSAAKAARKRLYPTTPATGIKRKIPYDTGATHKLTQ